MTMFLFDDFAGQSVIKPFLDWEAAEAHAESTHMTLVGEFVGWYDSDKEEWEYVN